MGSSSGLGAAGKAHALPRALSDELLRGLAAQGANMAKTEMRTRHRLNGILAGYFHGKGLQRFRLIEKDMGELFGDGWLNSGRAKDALFTILAASTSKIPLDAFVFVTGGDRFYQTPAFDALPPEEAHRIATTLHPRDCPEYFTPRDVLISTVQAPHRVCVLCQRVQPKGFLLIGEPEVMFCNQEEWQGRLKIWGAEIPPELAEVPDVQ